METSRKRDREDLVSDEGQEPCKDIKKDDYDESESPLHTSSLCLQTCRHITDSYDQLKLLTEGSFGIIWKARDKSSKEIVALKQFRYSSEIIDGLHPIGALREMEILLELKDQKNIVDIRELVRDDEDENLFMVMELMATDLQFTIEQQSTPFEPNDVRNAMLQVLMGLDHVHSHGYMHRDMKPANILLHSNIALSEARLALCDFGSARKYFKDKNYTAMVGTLCYRAPEILLGQVAYDFSMDMWSVGCIFGELVARNVVFPGRSELDQIDKIYNLLGVPNAETWPGYSAMPHSRLFNWKGSHESRLQQYFSEPQMTLLDEHGIELLKGLLCMDPTKRLDAKSALKHSYFDKNSK